MPTPPRTTTGRSACPDASTQGGRVADAGITHPPAGGPSVALQAVQSVPDEVGDRAEEAGLGRRAPAGPDAAWGGHRSAGGKGVICWRVKPDNPEVALWRTTMTTLDRFPYETLS